MPAEPFVTVAVKTTEPPTQTVELLAVMLTDTFSQITVVLTSKKTRPQLSVMIAVMRQLEVVDTEGGINVVYESVQTEKDKCVHLMFLMIYNLSFF